MAKYIDADKLKRLVGELKEQARRNCCDSWGIVPDALEEVEGFIDSLQQEQPEVDLEEETIRVEFRTIADKCFNEGIEGWEREKLIARHFYDLGCRRTAEKYDDIEYNRQMSEESVPNDLEEAAERYSKDYESGPNRIAINAFIAGANWQKAQDDRLVDIIYQQGIEKGKDEQKEQDTRDMYMSDNRHFQKVYELGKKDMKEQMMKEAVEGIVRPDDCEIWVNLVGYGYKFNDGDKVRIIVVKEED